MFFMQPTKHIVNNTEIFLRPVSYYLAREINNVDPQDQVLLIVKETLTDSDGNLAFNGATLEDVANNIPFALATEIASIAFQANDEANDIPK